MRGRGKPGPMADGTTPAPSLPVAGLPGLSRRVGELGAGGGLHYPENHLIRLRI